MNIASHFFGGSIFQRRICKIRIYLSLLIYILYIILYSTCNGLTLILLCAPIYIRYVRLCWKVRILPHNTVYSRIQPCLVNTAYSPTVHTTTHAKQLFEGFRTYLLTNKLGLSWAKLRPRLAILTASFKYSINLIDYIT